MSGSISQFGDSGISILMRQAVSTLSNQQQALENQTASGVASDSYAGLGDSRGQALSLDPAITQVNAWSSNITNAQNQLTVTQSALGQIGSIASSLSTTLTSLTGSPSQSTVALAAAQARQSLQTLGSLLNTKSGDAYVFAGTQSQTAPVTSGQNLADSPVAGLISQEVRQLSTAGAGNVLSQTLSLASNTAAGSPFSSALSVTPDQAATMASTPVIGHSETLAVGIVATQGNVPTATSTGSPIRDLMRNLMAVASLTPETTSNANYTNLIQGLTASNNAAADGITTMSTSVGLTQNTLTNRAGTLSQLQNSLATQLGNTRDIGLATVSVQLTSVQTSLQASYSIIANMKGMTLADYI